MKAVGTIGHRVAALEAKVDQHSSQLSQRPEKGDTGAAGLSIKGDAGEKGADGASIKGERGDPGSPGEHGRNGRDGVDAVGIQGPQGKTGRDGRDADVSVIEKAMGEIMSLRDHMAGNLKDTNHQRQVDLTACRNAIKEQNAEIAKMRGELENVRLMLQGFYDINSKSGEYVAWLRERTAKILKQSRGNS